LVVAWKPCCHTAEHPPLPGGGVNRRRHSAGVVVGNADSWIPGNGRRRPRPIAGPLELKVIEAVRQSEGGCRLKRAFCHRVRSGRPLGCFKWAMS